MTWQGKRRAQLPADWAARRQARLELDGFRCTATLKDTDGLVFAAGSWERERIAEALSGPGDRCPRRATDVHHELDAHDHRIEALRSLCAGHHKAETQREAQQAQGRGIARLRPKRPHPGLR